MESNKLISIVKKKQHKQPHYTKNLQNTNKDEGAHSQDKNNRQGKSLLWFSFCVSSVSVSPIKETVKALIRAF